MIAHLLIAVWGKSYIEEFFDLTLPSLLAEKNIPELQKSHEDVQLVIYTKESEVLHFTSSKIFQQAEKKVRCVLISHPDEEFSKVNHISMHHKLWNLGLQRAKLDKAWVAFIPSDFIFSNGFLKTTASLIEKGNWAVYVQQHRVTAETFLPELKEKYPDPCKREISPRHLVDMLIRHIHPIQAAYFHSQRHFCPHAELLFYPISPTEFYGTTISTLPIAADSTRFQPNDQGHIMASNSDHHDQIAFITDSDDGVVLGTGTRGQYAEMYMHFYQLSTDTFARWLKSFYSTCYKPMIAQDYYYHSSDPSPPEKLNFVRSRARYLKTLSLINFRIYSIWNAAMQLKCTNAANILAFAYQQWNLGRHWPGKEPATILLPENKTLEEGGLPENILSTLKKGHQKQLLEMLFEHTLRVPVSLDFETPAIHPAVVDGNWVKKLDEKTFIFKTYGKRSVTIRIEEGTLFLNDSKITGLPVITDEFLIYSINKPLFEYSLHSTPSTKKYLRRSTITPDPITDSRMTSSSLNLPPLPPRLSKITSPDKRIQIAHSLYEDAFYLRVLAQIEDVLSHYAGQMELTPETLPALKEIHDIGSYKLFLNRSTDLFYWACELNPDHSEALYQLAELCFYQRSYQASHDLFKRAYLLGRTLAGKYDDLVFKGNAAYFMAQCLMRLGHPKETYETLLVALTHLPHHHIINNQLGRFLLEQENLPLKTALSHFSNSMTYSIHWLAALPPIPEDLPTYCKKALSKHRAYTRSMPPEVSNTPTRSNPSQEQLINS